MEGKFSEFNNFRESDISMKVIFWQVSVMLFRMGPKWSLPTIHWTSPNRDPQALALQPWPCPPSLRRAPLAPLYRDPLPGLGSGSLLLASGGQEQRPVQTCSLADPSWCWHLVSGYWSRYGERAVGTHRTGMLSCFVTVKKLIDNTLDVDRTWLKHCFFGSM